MIMISYILSLNSVLSGFILSLHIYWACSLFTFIFPTTNTFCICIHLWQSVSLILALIFSLLLIELRGRVQVIILISLFFLNQFYVTTKSEFITFCFVKHVLTWFQMNNVESWWSCQLFTLFKKLLDSLVLPAYVVTFLQWTNTL